MTKACKARIAQSKERLDMLLRSDAKRFGHHGVVNFIEVVRQRHNVAITPEYAAELIAHNR